MDTLTPHDIVFATMEDIGVSWDAGDLDYCTGYAEPGYGADDTLIVFANWNDERLAPLADVIEATDGAELEWSDEWVRCDDCYRALRTSGDSYGWRMFGAWVDDCSIVCADCLCSDMDSSLEQYHNDADKAVTWCNARDMAAAGWTQYAADDPREYETGWHPGQTDDPHHVFETIREELGSDVDVVFLIDSTGQFDVSWSAWTREEQS